MPKLSPREVDFADTAPIQITTNVTVNGTPEEVWAVLTDNERWPEWFSAAKECRTTSDKPQGVGSTRWIHVDLFKVNERFVAWDPPHRWAFTILDLNLPGVISVVERALIEPTGEGKTEVSYTMGTTSPWLALGTEPPADATSEIFIETRAEARDRQPGSCRASWWSAGSGRASVLNVCSTRFHGPPCNEVSIDLSVGVPAR